MRCLKRKQRNSGYRRSSRDVKTPNYQQDVGSKCDQQDLWLHGEQRHRQVLLCAPSTAEGPEQAGKFTMSTGVLLHLDWDGLKYIHPHNHYMFLKDELDQNLVTMGYCCGYLHHNLFCQFQHRVYKTINMIEVFKCTFFFLRLFRCGAFKYIKIALCFEGSHKQSAK